VVVEEEEEEEEDRRRFRIYSKSKCGKFELTGTRGN
jgi:hypothetical protein